MVTNKTAHVAPDPTAHVAPDPTAHVAPDPTAHVAPDPTAPTAPDPAGPSAPGSTTSDSATRAARAEARHAAHAEAAASAEHTRATDTYVVQVQSGREHRALRLIERMVPRATYREVFVPTYDKQVKRSGVWHREQALLVPGYLYLTTPDINTVVQHLRAIPALTRVLRTDARFVPLTGEELAWLEQLTEPGKRSVGMSRGVIEGDHVRIIAGPLKGHEARIAKVDRHHRTAQIEFRILGRSTLVRVGLEIVEKQA